MTRPRFAAPVERRNSRTKDAQRCFSGIRSGPDGSTTLKVGRKADQSSVGIQKYLVRVEKVVLTWAVGSVERVPVVANIRGFVSREPAVPDPACFMNQIIERDAPRWCDQVARRVQQKRNARRVSGVKGEVVALFLV